MIYNGCKREKQAFLLASSYYHYLHWNELPCHCLALGNINANKLTEKGETGDGDMMTMTGHDEQVNTRQDESSRLGFHCGAGTKQK